jgi:tetratricopeptide (TPR) repeat protein/2-polyprenyl-3-methyl-5-hydroxy-6-metoxy-1,4-benzoquinol methylase
MTMAAAPADDSPPGAACSFAATMIDEGDALKKQGRISEAMARYDAAVKADPQCAPAHLNRGNILFASARFDEARSAYQLAIACDPQCVAAHLNLGNVNYRAGDFTQALQNYQATIGIRPQFADGFIGMANALAGLGRAAEAIQSYRQALSINPHNAECHFNLGVVASIQQRPHEAASSLRRSIELRPDHAPAHRILGAVLSSLGDLDAAEASLRRACHIDPASGELLSELAMLLQFRGKYPEAVLLLAHALESAPNWPNKVAFANCAGQTQFVPNDPLVRAALTTAITEAWVTPHNLCPSALSLIMLDERIAGCVRLANESWPARSPRGELFGAGGLAALSADPLLHALLMTVPVSSIQFERFLTCARCALLEIASGRQTPSVTDLAALKFYAALTRQCFVNEFVFDCSDREQLAAAGCRTTLLALLDTNAPVPPLLLLAVAAYFPLHLLPNAERLLTASEPGPVDDVLRQQIREPLEEQALSVGVERLTPIIGSVSEAVRDQYEQNPYPRWLKMQRREHPMPFNAELRRTLPLAPLSPMSDDSAPEVLIAGCGTGSDAIFVAQRFSGARVLAIDLSLRSISYAKRKTRELGLTNIEYAQADILKLAGSARRFDIIGAIGVLHHLADPFEGWRILLSLLRPGGSMCLGLYSQIARRSVLRAREFIAARGYASTPADIRRFRQDVFAQDASGELGLLSRSNVFYSMSDCRDLAFHVQEHQLTLGEIDSFLTEVGLRFIGFELDFRVLHQYRARFGDDPSCTDLRNWARFEADNPDTFTGMYRFWIQR